MNQNTEPQTAAHTAPQTETDAAVSAVVAMQQTADCRAEQLSAAAQTADADAVSYNEVHKRQLTETDRPEQQTIDRQLRQYRKASVRRWRLSDCSVGVSLLCAVESGQLTVWYAVNQSSAVWQKIPQYNGRYETLSDAVLAAAAVHSQRLTAAAGILNHS